MIRTFRRTVLQPSKIMLVVIQSFSPVAKKDNATAFKPVHYGFESRPAPETLGTVNTTARKKTTRKVGFFAGFRNCSAPDKYASALKEDKPFL